MSDLDERRAGSDESDEEDEDRDPMQKLIVEKSMLRHSEAGAQVAQGEAESDVAHDGAEDEEEEEEEAEAEDEEAEQESSEEEDDEEEGSAEEGEDERAMEPAPQPPGPPADAGTPAQAEAGAGTPASGGRTEEMTRLLRVPRYWDKDFEAAAIKCFKCGQSGHISRECTNQAKAKPCHLCGDRTHQRWECPNGLCWRCHQPGHKGVDCTATPASAGRTPGTPGGEFCMRCASSRHSIAACSSAYYEDDLALVQCFECFEFGHLCCRALTLTMPRPSCFNCGASGHREPDCSLPRPRLDGLQAQAVRPSYHQPVTECFRCGKEGHMKRDCPEPSFFVRQDRGPPGRMVPPPPRDAAWSPLRMPTPQMLFQSPGAPTGLPGQRAAYTGGAGGWPGMGPPPGAAGGGYAGAVGDRLEGHSWASVAREAGSKRHRDYQEEEHFSKTRKREHGGGGYRDRDEYGYTASRLGNPGQPRYNQQHEPRGHQSNHSNHNNHYRDRNSRRDDSRRHGGGGSRQDGSSHKRWR